MGAWKRGLEKAKKPNLAAKGQKAKFGCSEEVWKRPKKFGGLEGLDKAKKPNLGLERPGKSQKAKFGGLEKAKKPGLEGLEKAQIWFGKSQIWGLGGGLEKAKSQILGLWKRPKSQILGVWTGFGKRQKPKFGGLEGVWKGKKAKFGGLEGVWKRLKNQIWWLVGQKPNLAVLERSAKSQKTAFGGLEGLGKAQKPNLGAWRKRPNLGAWRGWKRPKSQIWGPGWRRSGKGKKKPNLEAGLESQKRRRGSGKGFVWRVLKRPRSQIWRLGGRLEKAKKPNLVACRGSGKGQKSQIWGLGGRPKKAGLGGGVEKAKKPNLGAWGGSGSQKAKFGGLEGGVWKKGKKPNLGWKGFGKGKKAKFGGLESVWKKAKKPNLGGLEGSGLEGVWNRPKSQIWGLGAVWKRPKSQNGGLGLKIIKDGVKHLLRRAHRKHQNEKIELQKFKGQEAVPLTAS